MSKIKIHFWEKYPWNLVSECFFFFFFFFFEPSLIQKKVLEDLLGIGGAFNENETSELRKSQILK